MPKLLATFLVTMLALALGAAPALAHGHGHGRAHYRHAKQASDYAYVATIDCGRGDVTVYSDEDLYAPLVDLDHHRTYLPIAWDVEVNGQTVLQDEKPQGPQAPQEHRQEVQLHRRRRHRHRHGAGPAPGRAQLTLKPSVSSTTRSPGDPQPGQRSTTPAPR